MNAKEKGIVTALKNISETANRAIQDATNAGMIGPATTAMMITRVTAEAAEIIEKQDAELTVLKTQPTTRLNLSDIGHLIHIIGSELQQYIIIAELQDKYLITPYPVRESEVLTNLRLIERTQAAFIDGTQRAVFNA
ncbi:TPA: hypothetical protein HJP54_003279 [Escherichia coli]|uniref:hypothetical protein n=1 Tax=Enterobacteriaceae TaxID=543 RepID=UPI0002A32311|nr:MULTISPECIES: hypothetical protein [Enterobacteriaceae]EAN0503765.1 hypothetical protein [Salmonella enterica]EAC1436217.1 hypothetical protein [Escherichia coli]EEQ3060951.1 hypothetical protein [Escherichia coli]EES2942294.1 hypothetical protein [Escherichia coli]EES4683517.1 hypothetical protein [Escherichia coli]